VHRGPRACSSDEEHRSGVLVWSAGAVLCNRVVWCGVVGCGVVWCGVVWCTIQRPHMVAALQWLRALQCTRAHGAWRTTAGGAICVVVLAPPSSFILHPSSFLLHPSSFCAPRHTPHLLALPPAAVHCPSLRPSRLLLLFRSQGFQALKLDGCVCVPLAPGVVGQVTLNSQGPITRKGAPCPMRTSLTGAQQKPHSDEEPLATRSTLRSDAQLAPPSPTNGAGLPPRENNKKVGTEMNRTGGIPPASQWCKDAAPFILGLGPEHNGASVAMPGEGGGTGTLL
jgi:hypothetical protein